MRNLKQHISGEHPQRKFWEQSGQKILCQIRVLGGNMRNLNIEGRGQNGRK